jgi:hypothetical protein
LPEHDLARIVHEALVGKHFEECNRLLFVGFYAVGLALIRPAHDAILRVVSPKRFEILCIPRIAQLLHVLLIVASIHNPPHELLI